MVDALGRVLAFALTPGQKGDAPQALDLLATLPAPDLCLVDTAYDSDRLRTLVVVRGTRPAIPSNPTRKRCHPFDKRAYKQLDAKVDADFLGGDFEDPARHEPGHDLRGIVRRIGTHQIGTHQIGTTGSRRAAWRCLMAVSAGGAAASLTITSASSPHPISQPNESAKVELSSRWSGGPRPHSRRAYDFHESSPV